jgi:hypothetical protein
MKQQNEEMSGGAKRRECGRKGVTDEERCTVKNNWNLVKEQVQSHICMINGFLNLIYV